MARSVNQALWDQWRQRLGRQRTSGLSIVEFCRSENVSPQRFHAWKRKLIPTPPPRHASGAAIGARRGRRRQVIAKPHTRAQQTPPRPAMPPGPAAFLQLPVSAAQGSPWIELALADGTILRLPQQNLAGLVAALRVLRGERLELPQGESGHA
jgi:hypothetical protein